MKTGNTLTVLMENIKKMTAEKYVIKVSIAKGIMVKDDDGDAYTEKYFPYSEKYINKIYNSRDVAKSIVGKMCNGFGHTWWDQAIVSETGVFDNMVIDGNSFPVRITYTVSPVSYEFINFNKVSKI